MKVLYFLIFILIASCNNNVNISNKKSILELQKKRMLHKQISSLKLIVGDSIDLSKKVILYSGSLREKAL